MIYEAQNAEIKQTPHALAHTYKDIHITSLNLYLYWIKKFQFISITFLNRIMEVPNFAFSNYPSTSQRNDNQNNHKSQKRVFGQSFNQNFAATAAPGLPFTHRTIPTANSEKSFTQEEIKQYTKGV